MLFNRYLFVLIISISSNVFAQTTNFSTYMEEVSVCGTSLSYSMNDHIPCVYTELKFPKFKNFEEPKAEVKEMKKIEKTKNRETTVKVSNFVLDLQEKNIVIKETINDMIDNNIQLKKKDVNFKFKTEF